MFFGVPSFLIQSLLLCLEAFGSSLDASRLFCRNSLSLPLTSSLSFWSCSTRQNTSNKLSGSFRWRMCPRQAPKQRAKFMHRHLQMQCRTQRHDTAGAKTNSAVRAVRRWAARMMQLHTATSRWYREPSTFLTTSRSRSHEKSIATARVSITIYEVGADPRDREGRPPMQHCDAPAQRSALALAQ